MAIAFDATGRSGNGWTTNVSSVTYPITVTGSNTFMVTGVGTYNTAARSVSGVTYNGVAFTKANGITSAIESANQDSELWYLDAPATGNHDVVVTLSASTEFVQALSASYTGKTSTGIDANAATQDLVGSASSPACNVTVVASDCWLVDFAYQRRNEAPAAGTATTNRITGGSGHALGDSNAVVGTGSQTLAFTVTAGSPAWCGVNSLSFSTAGSGGTTDGVGSSSGVGAATATGAATAASVYASAGIATAAATGASIFSAVYSSTGVATVLGVGDTAGGISSGVASSSGIGAATAVGRSFAAGVYSSSGVTTASAVGTNSSAIPIKSMLFSLGYRTQVMSTTRRTATYTLNNRALTFSLLQ